MKSTLDLMNELRQMAKALSSTTGQPINRLHMAVGMAGEAGEILEVEKKREFQGFGETWANSQIIPEVGDLMFYLLDYIDDAGIELRDCLVAVIAKLKCRYPNDEFHAVDSIDRDKTRERLAIRDALERDRKERGL